MSILSRKRQIARVVVLFLLISFMSFGQRTSSAQTDIKRVLFLNSYGSSHDSFSDKYIGLKAVFDQAGVIFDMAFLDSKRFKNEENYSHFYEMLHYRIKNAEPYDAIVVSDDDALHFAIEHQQSLFFETPIVFLGINALDFALEAGEDPWITGVVESISVKETVSMAKKLNPRAKKVLALVDQSITGQANLNMFYAVESEFPDLAFSALDLGAFSLEDYLLELKSINDDTIVIYLAAFQDKMGKNLGYLESTTLMSKNCQVPVYQISDIGIGSGITGGYVINFVSQGNEAAKMVLAIFEGQPVASIEVMTKSPNIYKFDYEKMQAFNLDKDLLPSNALLINYDASLLEEYLPVVLVTLFVLGLQVVIIFILILNIRKRHYVEKNLLFQNLEIRDLNSELYYAKEGLETLNTTLEHRVILRSQELETAIAELHKKERLASLGSLVAGISHEVNTPLGVAITAGSYLNDESKRCYDALNNQNFTKNDLFAYLSTVDETSDIINRNLVRAADLIQSFKSIAVNQSSEVEAVFNLREHIDLIVLTLKHEYKNTRYTITNAVDESILLKSYPGAWAQIVTNFIINSLTHGFKNKENGSVVMSATVSGNELNFVYKDDGNGIDPNQLQRIFDPFFTTNRQSGGSGLGLNILYNLVTDRLNGRIKCIGDFDKGLKFEIVVPLA